MKLADYIDTTKLRHYVTQEYVTARRHKSLPLTIYCYSRRTVRDQVWDDVTTKTRGLIVDDNDEVIARPYEKFFSIDQYPTLLTEAEEAEKLLHGPPVITEKVNGCLGIFWRYGIHWGIASKGSFHSPHAEWATKWMEDHIEKNGKLIFPEGYTPVFEIICQEIQPHTIKYKNDGLVLLNFVKIDTGEELDRDLTCDYINKNHLWYATQYLIDLSYALNEDYQPNGMEGYVVTYNRPGTTPLKIKIKFPTFIKNRKLFYEEQKLKANPEKTEQYEVMRKRAADIVQDSLVKCTTRKETADYFNRLENKDYAQICFAILDQDKDAQKRAINRLLEKVMVLNG